LDHAPAACHGPRPAGARGI